MRVTSAKKNGKAITAWSRAWRHRKWLRTGFPQHHGCGDEFDFSSEFAPDRIALSVEVKIFGNEIRVD